MTIPASKVLEFNSKPEMCDSVFKNLFQKKKMKTFEVTVCADVTFYISAEDKETAVDIAYDQLASSLHGPGLSHFDMQGSDVMEIGEEGFADDDQ
jgi:hypothetical protein